jgi:hypothetical protein
MKTFAEKSLKEQKKDLIISFSIVGIVLFTILGLIAYGILSSNLAFSIPQGITWWAYLLSSVASLMIFLFGIVLIFIGIASMIEIRGDYQMPQAIFAGSIFAYASLIFFIATQLYHPGRWVLYNLFFYL